MRRDAQRATQSRREAVAVFGWVQRGLELAGLQNLFYGLVGSDRCEAEAVDQQGDRSVIPVLVNVAGVDGLAYQFRRTWKAYKVPSFVISSRANSLGVTWQLSSGMMGFFAWCMASAYLMQGQVAS